MSFIESHAEWLSLIEISGPFLAVPVLKDVFPQGLEQLDANKRKRLRQAYEEWRDALENDAPYFPELHQAWINEVLDRGLELDEDGRGDVLKRGTAIPDKLIIDLPEYGVKLAPDAAVIDEQSGNALMLIQTFSVHTDLEATSKRDGWVTSPAERMVNLCRKAGCRLGLLTNGERWMLVDAPVGAVTTFAIWYARLWGQEPVTLQAFVHLLGIRRFFVDDSERLPALFDRSLKHQDEVTEALGEQVRRAVEVLIQALDKADLDRDRTLLVDVSTAEIYEAALTVMMRLVFLLSAEERGLLLLGDERYEAHYALSTLRMQLRADSAEILERRWDAWSRLLALFRAVYGGIEHENLRMPALGGSLFDPDRFPFLEGRDKHSQWRTDPAKPLPIDNRTVLLLLDAIQQFQGRTLSYRALDVEQIGYVYEGLLERTVKRAKDVTLELDATKSAKSPWVTLTELETARKAGDEKLADLLRERSGSSASRIRNDLAKNVDDVLADKLLTVCHADVALRDRIKPYASLLRVDPWGYPLVYPTGSFMATTGSDRRETGTHYTPKSLTEAIVTETLTPVVYVGPAEGKPREEWQLKSAAELMNLKICDPAMGSGAFLVQVCRWLAERLVEAWSQAELAGKYVTVDGDVRDTVTGDEPLPRDDEERIVIARRLIAERCLYGVDLNPLAVELAKLSIWLVTLAKGRPFGFLDHNLRCGDSLLGIHRLDQLTELSMKPDQKNTQMRIFGRNIEQAVAEAIELRKCLRRMPIRDIHDVEAMARLDAEAKAKLESPEQIADAFIGEVFRTGGNQNALDVALMALSIEAQQYLQGDIESGKHLRNRACQGLASDLPDSANKRKPFHWPVEFPEVFSDKNPGFDAMIGNPPFLAGKRITNAFGEKYREFLVNCISGGRRGNADLCSYFCLQFSILSRGNGIIGMLATSTLSQGETREVSLNQIENSGFSIIRAEKSYKWPGTANLAVSNVWIVKGNWQGVFYLDGKAVNGITPMLTKRGALIGEPYRLASNIGKAFQGSNITGVGFILDPKLAHELFNKSIHNKDVIFPFLGGSDILSKVDQMPSRWVINFFDWDEEKAASYSDPFEIVKKLVLPERMKIKDEIKRKSLTRDFWKYNSQAKQLYKKIQNLDRYLVHPYTGKHHVFQFYSHGITLAHTTTIVALSGWDDFALLQSAIHWIWALEYGNKLETRPQYAPSNCFDNFPFPVKPINSLEDIGKKFHSARTNTMSSRQKGATAIYNLVDDQSEKSSDIRELRNLQIELDAAVLLSYDWQDIELRHGFYKTALGTQFTISDAAREEILQRLLELNYNYYQEEQAHGKHEKNLAKSKPSSKRTVSSFDKIIQTNLFDLSVQPIEPSSSSEKPKTGNTWGTTASDQILAWLEAHKGWFTKSAILNGCGADANDWDSAIVELLSDEYIESQGDQDSRRYRAKS